MTRFEKFLVFVSLGLALLNALQFYNSNKKPEYLMTMRKEIFDEVMDAEERQILTEILFRYSQQIHPEWKDRAMWVYDHNNIYHILFVKGTVKVMPSIKQNVKKESNDL